MSGDSFTREEITDLLTELGSDLHTLGIQAELFIVGGAAMALAYNSRRATRDIDAVFEPKTEIYEAAARLAARRDLPGDWLNDAMKGFLPGPDPNRRALFSSAGINVSVPSPEYLLALKVYAARVDRDTDDIKRLAEICGVSSSDEVLAITERIMGRGQLLPKAQFLVEELFPQS